MIIEIIRYKISEDRRKEFENAYRESESSLTTSTHCLGYEISHCIEKPDQYIIRIKWDSLEGHLKGFRASPEFQEFFQAVRSFYNDIEEMQHYEIIHTSA
jgi:heme-degrading monooxygenase HmoA